MKNLTKWLAIATMAGSLATASAAAAADTVDWVDWTSRTTATTILGTITSGATSVGVQYDGDLLFAQIVPAAPIDYWVDLGYTQGLVNRPTGNDIIALDAGGLKTITFSQAVVDPYARADFFVSIGPEGGAGGGVILAEGPPEEIVKSGAGYTGRYLKPVLDAHSGRKARPGQDTAAPVLRTARRRKVSGDLLG